MESISLRPLSVLLVITELDPGGAEKCMCDLAIFLAMRGHRVKVLAVGPQPNAARATLVRRLQAASVPIEFGEGQGLKNLPRIAGWLRKSIREFRPDIVQSMLWHANVLCALVSDPRSTKLVGGVRVSDPSRWRSWVQGWLASRFMKMVCVSNDVARWCHTRERIPYSKLVVIPNGIEVSPQKELMSDWTQFGLPTDARTLLVMGRLEKQKGCVELLEHADELLSRLTDHHLIFMGLGSQEALLRSMASRSFHAARIHFVGWQPDGAKWMAAAEILLLPARYEGMPNVLLEAMANSRPFVAFAVEGVRELLVAANADLQTHQVANAGDWNRFLECCTTLANDLVLRTSVGRDNQRQILEHFQLKDQLMKYESLYRQCLIGG